MKRQGQGKKQIIIGLTGSFGSGKSTVAGIFKSFGAKVIDADDIAHRIIAPGTKAHKNIIDAFGRRILKVDRAIDRAKLSGIVFNDKRFLKELNRIVHPEIIRVIKKKIKISSAKLIVLDAPLLIEAGLKYLVDKLAVVTATKKNQIGRAGKKMGISKTAVLKRIDSQIPLRNKVRLADFVIDNNGTIQETKKQVQEIRRNLWRN